MSDELDIETLTRPGGMVPVDIHTTSELVRHVLRQRAVEADLRSALSFVSAQRDHWHDLVPLSDRVKFPFVDAEVSERTDTDQISVIPSVGSVS